MSNQSKGSATSSEKSEQWALAWVLAINTARQPLWGIRVVGSVNRIDGLCTR